MALEEPADTNREEIRTFGDVSVLVSDYDAQVFRELGGLEIDVTRWGGVSYRFGSVMNSAC